MSNNTNIKQDIVQEEQKIIAGTQSEEQESRRDQYSSHRRER